ncbi:MAG: hypothetical protein IKL35_04260 [Muribaculaceae bacterium]|nr:hypothetical protein [Muribaculaceae bacterium]
MRRITLFLMMSIVVLCGNATIEVSSIVKNVISGDGSVREKVRMETKYLKFTSKRGNFVRYADYEIPEFKTSDALLGSAKIRQYMDIATNKSTCFLMITVGREKATEVVAYDDLVKMIYAVKTLKQQSVKDSIAGHTLKYYYVTDDGFQIGYNIKKDKLSWYFSVDGDERKFSKDFDFEQALVEVKNKMEELMQGEIKK